MLLFIETFQLDSERFTQQLMSRTLVTLQKLKIIIDIYEVSQFRNLSSQLFELRTALIPR